MTLTMVVNVEHSNVTLKEQHSLVIGNLYDPLRLEFSSGYSPTFQKLKVKLYRPDTGELIAYTTKEFVRDPDTPTVGVGRLNLATTDVKEWAETLYTDSDPATETNGSVQVVVCEVWDNDDNSIVYANCEVPITLTKGVAVPLSGDSDFATREYVASQIKQALEGLELECSCPTGGSGSTDDPTVAVKNLLVRGEVTSSKNMPVSFQIEDSDTVVGSGSSETPPDPTCVYYDIKTRILYGATPDEKSLQAIGPRLYRDVHLMPLGGKPYSLGQLKTGEMTDTPVVEFVQTPLNVGYYDPAYDRFFYNTGKIMEALRPNGDRIPDAEGILYLDNASSQLFRYDGSKIREDGDGAGGYYPIAADVGPEIRQNLVTSVTVDDTMHYDRDMKYGYAFPVGIEEDEATGGKKLNIGGMLGYAVAVGRLDSDGRFWSALGGAEKEYELVGDPRRLYVVTENAKDGTTGLFTFNNDPDSRGFELCVSSSNVDMSGVVKAIKGPVGDPCTPDDNGTVDISDAIPAQIVVGKMTDQGFFPTNGDPVVNGGPKTLYVDSANGKLYYWSEEREDQGFKKVPLTPDDEKTPVTTVTVNEVPREPDKNGVVDLGSLLSSALEVGTLTSSTEFTSELGQPAAVSSGKLYIDRSKNTIYRYSDVDKKFSVVVEPTGDANVIESVKLNGRTLGVSNKQVDLGNLLNTAVVLGTVTNDLQFKPDGHASTIAGDLNHIYVDRNTNYLYLSDGQKMYRIAEPSLTGVKLNGSNVLLDGKTADLGSLVTDVKVNGQSVRTASGTANIEVAEAGDTRVQHVVSLYYDFDNGSLPVVISDTHVQSGASIFKFGSVRNDGQMTLDVSAVVQKWIKTDRAYTFEVWVMNSNISSPVNITRPAMAVTKKSGEYTADITWLSGDSVTELASGSALYMTFRVAPGWDGGLYKPLIQASIYHVG